jgi:enoyl-CoA hydratase/carnithine racemase
MAETLDLADVVAANPPVALTATKRLLWRGLHTDLRQAIENESYYNVWLRRTSDSVEAIAAFQEKRTPVFTGR